MNVLVDTDVVIDYLDGKRDVVARFSSPELVLYCSSITVAEVCASRSLGATQKQATRTTLRRLFRVLSHRDPAVTSTYDTLKSRYASHLLRKGDALIAATAVAKGMPLWTKNQRHFKKIEGLELFDAAD